MRIAGVVIAGCFTAAGAAWLRSRSVLQRRGDAVMGIAGVDVAVSPLLMSLGALHRVQCCDDVLCYYGTTRVVIAVSPLLKSLGSDHVQCCNDAVTLLWVSRE